MTDKIAPRRSDVGISDDIAEHEDERLNPGHEQGMRVDHGGILRPQDDAELTSDMLSERSHPGRHGGAGSPGRTGRPKNREVENEMIKPPAKDGEPPRPATEPPKDEGLSRRTARSPQ